MNPSAWYIAANVIAIVVCIVCTLVVLASTLTIAYFLRTLIKILGAPMEVMMQLARPLEKLVEGLDNVGTVAVELKDLQEGMVRVMGQVAKNTTELRMTVEEFQASVFAPRQDAPKPRRRGAGGVDEQAEIVQEQQRKHSEVVAKGAELDAFLDERGKHGGVV